jgi:ParB/RepB/Spo0J family partition protein
MRGSLTSGSRHPLFTTGKQRKGKTTVNTLNFKIEKLAVMSLKPGPNIRKDVLQAEIDALAESLKVQQMQPIVVGPDMAIIDGWRRWLAAQKAKMESIWAVVTNRPLSRDELVQAQLAMDLHRKNLTDQERVAACEELLATTPSLNQKQLAERLSVDAATVSRWLCVSTDRVIAPVREAFFGGAIGLKAAYPISQAAKEFQQALLELAVAGATRQQLTTEVRRQERNATTPDSRASRIRCVLPGGGSVIVCGEALSVDDIIEQLTVLLREAKRARDQSLELKTWERMLSDKAKAANG